VARSQRVMSLSARLVHAPGRASSPTAASPAARRGRRALAQTRAHGRRAGMRQSGRSGTA
jgi:hypothetical protein